MVLGLATFSPRWSRAWVVVGHEGGQHAIEVRSFQISAQSKHSVRTVRTHAFGVGVRAWSLGLLDSPDESALQTVATQSPPLIDKTTEALNAIVAALHAAAAKADEVQLDTINDAYADHVVQMMAVSLGAESPGGRVDDGVDTFVFERGLIKLQTISFSPQLNQ